MTSFEGHKSRETGYLLCAGGESKPSVFLLLETFFAKSRGDVFGTGLFVCMFGCASALVCTFATATKSC